VDAALADVVPEVLVDVLREVEGVFVQRDDSPVVDRLDPFLLLRGEFDLVGLEPRVHLRQFDRPVVLAGDEVLVRFVAVELFVCHWNEEPSCDIQRWGIGQYRGRGARERSNSGTGKRRSTRRLCHPAAQSAPVVSRPEFAATAATAVRIRIAHELRFPVPGHLTPAGPAFDPVVRLREQVAGDRRLQSICPGLELAAVAGVAVLVQQVDVDQFVADGLRRRAPPTLLKQFPRERHRLWLPVPVLHRPGPALRALAHLPLQVVDGHREVVVPRHLAGVHPRDCEELVCGDVALDGVELRVEGRGVACHGVRGAWRFMACRPVGTASATADSLPWSKTLVQLGASEPRRLR